MKYSFFLFLLSIAPVYALEQEQELINQKRFELALRLFSEGNKIYDGGSPILKNLRSELPEAHPLRAQAIQLLTSHSPSAPLPSQSPSKADEHASLLAALTLRQRGQFAAARKQFYALWRHARDTDIKGEAYHQRNDMEKKGEVPLRTIHLY